jgi:Tripartite tricarboxylate transporter family receptor
VTTAVRLDALPDVPTVGETLADYEVVAWTGIGAPKGTPPAIVEKLNREINSGLTNLNTKARLTELTTVPLVLSPEQFGSHMAAEIERWGEVVKSLALSRADFWGIGVIGHRVVAERSFESLAMRSGTRVMRFRLAPKAGCFVAECHWRIVQCN